MQSLPRGAVPAGLQGLPLGGLLLATLLATSPPTGAAAAPPCIHCDAGNATAGPISFPEIILATSARPFSAPRAVPSAARPSSAPEAIASASLARPFSAPDVATPTRTAPRTFLLGPASAARPKSVAGVVVATAAASRARTTAAPPYRAAGRPKEQLVFADEFDQLDPTVWKHLVTAWRGGNQEFQYYRNDRRNSYVRGGVLYLKPTLTAREFGDAFLYTGRLYYPDCNFDPCVSESGADIVLPIQSARIDTNKAFSFRYGRLEVRAKLPRGDWIWPAIWLKPAHNAYGPWPASGEIDLMESRGNANLRAYNGEPQGVQKVVSTLHFGPNRSYNIWRLTHWEKIVERGDFADAFHVFGMEWSPDGFRFTVDKKEIGRMAPPKGGFWSLGKFDQDPGGPNIWANGTELAPFDKKFYIILNVAVGGTFFPNGMINSPYPRPWNWTSGRPLREFWEYRQWWLPSWRGEDAAMQVDYVRVYQTT